MQTTTGYLTDAQSPEELDLSGRVSMSDVVLPSLIHASPAKDLVVLVEGNTMLVTGLHFDNVTQILHQSRSPNKLRCFWTEAKLTAIVGAPTEHSSVNSDGQSVGIAAADLFDELILEARDHPGVEDLLLDHFLSEVSHGVMTQLALSVGAPGVQHSLDIALVDAAVL